MPWQERHAMGTPSSICFGAQYSSTYIANDSIAQQSTRVASLAQKTNFGNSGILALVVKTA